MLETIALDRARVRALEGEPRHRPRFERHGESVLVVVPVWTRTGDEVVVVWAEPSRLSVAPARAVALASAVIERLEAWSAAAALASLLSELATRSVEATAPLLRGVRRFRHQLVRRTLDAQRAIVLAALEAGLPRAELRSAERLLADGAAALLGLDAGKSSRKLSTVEV